mmetsp:Transcript_96427/g.268038  ORF Transcript_96427/g.268038 Transcript_96427/m.268038 type:complete len:206 (+) Transcript_96427:228-845(+)
MRNGWRSAMAASSLGLTGASGTGWAWPAISVTRVSCNWLWRSGLCRAAANSSAPAPTSVRPRLLNSTRGSCGAAACSWRARDTPSISGMCMSSTARSKGSDSASCRASSGDAVSRTTMPHLPACSARMRRLVALSSTTSMRRPLSAGCAPIRSRRGPGARAAACSGSVKQKRQPWPGPALSAHSRPPISSTSRRLMARPRPVPPY